VVVVVATVLALASGCTFGGLNDVPLPGGADLGRDPLHVTVELADTVNLARQSAVKVDDVTVGTVRSIRLDGWQPEVEVLLARDVHLPANAVAAVRQTGLLGEKYLELSAPHGAAARGRLADGAVIGVDRTTRSVEVEEVLGALSLLLNGGGIDRVRTITVELHRALGGRTDEWRGLLRELDGFTATLDRNRGAIVAAIDGLDRLTTKVAAGHRVIARALDTIGPALTVLADQRTQLTRVLRASTGLAKVGSRVVTQTQRDLVANLDALAPTLSRLAEAGDDLPRALEYMLSFPFPDALVDSVHGDYVNSRIRIDLSLPTFVRLLGLTPPAATREENR
jgi:phospholipid/cholesterol/gamma-HCH transport system substrate-binding protein